MRRAPQLSSPLLLLLLLLLVAAAVARPSQSGPVARLTDAPAGDDWLPRPGDERDEAERPRRIVPKSLFVAPGRQSAPCSAGYRADGRGRCVRFLWVDRGVHLSFLVSQLNGRFGAGAGASATKISDEVNRGPLRVALGIASETVAAPDGDAGDPAA